MDQKNEFDFLRYGVALWRRKWMIVAVTIVALSAAFVATRLGAGEEEDAEEIVIADVYRTAQKLGFEKVVAKMAAPQTGARKIFERLGFRVDSVLPDYIKDADGMPQSLVVMSRSLDETWKELRDFYRTDDWPDG